VRRAGRGGKTAAWGSDGAKEEAKEETKARRKATRPTIAVVHDKPAMVFCSGIQVLYSFLSLALHGAYPECGHAWA
jgi:hypothetical protein